MSDNSGRCIPIGQMIAMIISACAFIGGIAFSLTARSDAKVIETGLQQDTRIRYLENRSAARDEQYKAIEEKLNRIQLLLEKQINSKS